MRQTDKYTDLSSLNVWIGYLTSMTAFIEIEEKEAFKLKLI